MLSDQDKKEMLADGLSRERRKKFLLAEQQKPEAPRTSGYPDSPVPGNLISGSPSSSIGYDKIASCQYIVNKCTCLLISVVVWYTFSGCVI